MQSGPAGFFTNKCCKPKADECATTVRVQYFGAMRAAAGTHEEALAVSADSTVYRLLNRLCDTYGEAFRCEVFRRDGESIRDDLILSLNGAIIEHANVIGTGMASGDVVALFPIFPGGG